MHRTRCQKHSSLLRPPSSETSPDASRTSVPCTTQSPTTPHSQNEVPAIIVVAWRQPLGGAFRNFVLSVLDSAHLFANDVDWSGRTIDVHPVERDKKVLCHWIVLPAMYAKPCQNASKSSVPVHPEFVPIPISALHYSCDRSSCSLRLLHPPWRRQRKPAVRANDQIFPSALGVVAHFEGTRDVREKGRAWKLTSIKSLTVPIFSTAHIRPASLLFRRTPPFPTAWIHAYLQHSKGKGNRQTRGGGRC